MEPAVLAARDEVVADDQRGGVPVAVPQPGLQRVGSIESSAHSSTGSPTVDGQDAQLVVARAAVDEREPVGVDGDRALGEVAGRERREDRLARGRVDEVELVVVGAEDHPGPAVALEHRRLADPARAAPRAGLAVLAGCAAHPGARVAPQDTGLPSGRARRRGTCGSGCRGTSAGRRPRPPRSTDVVAVGQSRRLGRGRRRRDGRGRSRAAVGATCAHGRRRGVGRGTARAVGRSDAGLGAGVGVERHRRSPRPDEPDCCTPPAARRGCSKPATAHDRDGSHTGGASIQHSRRGGSVASPVVPTVAAAARRLSSRWQH